MQPNSQKNQNCINLMRSVCVMHSLILERGKYGSIGWNVPYEFNENDLRLSLLEV